MGKGEAIVDTQAEVIIMEQGEPRGREPGVTWDQRSDGRWGEMQLWSHTPASEAPI